MNYQLRDPRLVVALLLPKQADLLKAHGLNFSRYNVDNGPPV